MADPNRKKDPEMVSRAMNCGTSLVTPPRVRVARTVQMEQPSGRRSVGKLSAWTISV